MRYYLFGDLCNSSIYLKSVYFGFRLHQPQRKRYRRVSTIRSYFKNFFYLIFAYYFLQNATFLWTSVHHPTLLTELINKFKSLPRLIFRTMLQDIAQKLLLNSLGTFPFHYLITTRRPPELLTFKKELVLGWREWRAHCIHNPSCNRFWQKANHIILSTGLSWQIRP